MNSGWKEPGNAFWKNRLDIVKQASVARINSVDKGRLYKWIDK